MTQLQHLSLFTNRVTGTIGSWIGAMRSLGAGPEGWLDLTANRLSGSIPLQISQLRNFHSNIGLGSGYTCPLPPVTFVNRNHQLRSVRTSKGARGIAIHCMDRNYKVNGWMELTRGTGGWAGPLGFGEAHASRTPVTCRWAYVCHWCECHLC